MDAARQFETVHAGHVCVQQNQAEGLSAAIGPLDGFERLLATSNCNRLHPPATEELLEDAPVDGVVVYNERRHVPQGLEAHRRTVSNLRSGKLQFHGDMKRAACAGLAFDPQAPTHEVDQLA